MNLIQIGREVRKMTECLSRAQMEPEEAKLAKEYSDLCALANQRLLQCASMIDAADIHQALQLAEVRPPLLDLVTLLAFKQADEWCARCRTNHLPIPEPLDARSIKSLNAIYSKGIAANTPLYKNYREAMMQNDDAKAMAVLRMIVRLNPGDSNAIQELKKLEEKDLAARLHGLGVSIQAADQKAVLEQIQEIESLAPTFPKDNEIWRKAQAIRCKILFRELQELRREDLWADSFALLSQIRQLCAEFSVELTGHSSQEMSEIEQWARQQAKNQAEQDNFNRIMGELGILLDSDRFGPVSKLGLEDLKQETKILGSKRRELDQFAQTIPPDLENRLNQVLQDLRVNIHKQQTRKARMFRLGLAAGTMVLIASALICFEWRRETGMATALQSLVESRQITTIEKLIPSVSHQHVISPRLAKTLQTAGDYLKQTRQAAEQCVQGVAQLNAYSNNDLAGSDPEQIYRRRADLLKEIKALPADVQIDPRLSLSPFENHWNSFLAQEGPQRSAKFNKLFAEAKSRVQSMADSSLSDGPSEDEQKIIALESMLEGLINSAVPALQIDRTAADNFHTFREEWETWRSTTASLRAPESLAAYLNALRRLQTCGYFSTKSVSTAATIASLDMDAWHLKASLILPGGELAKLTNHNTAEKAAFYPADMRPAEKDRYLELRDDEQIHQVWLYNMDKDHFTPLTAGREYTVYSIGPIVTKANKQLGRVYDPVASPDDLNFKNVSNYIDETHFKEEGRHALEYWAYEKIGFGNLIDSQTGAYQTALLEILDRVNRETNSSPLFRAFLAMKLYNMIDVRPVEWGYIWCPAAAADRQRLVDLGAGRLQSGNWYVPSLIQSEGDRFEKYFESVRATSYMKQARFYQTLAQRLDSADFSFAGYVHPDRGLITALKAKSTSLWGFGKNGKLALLYKLNPQATGYDREQTPLPFSPVFCFAQDYHLDVEQACEAAGLERTAPSIAACPLVAE